MRNLKQYPITEDEVIRVLENARGDIHAWALGDTRPVVLSYIEEFLKANPYAFHLFLKSKEIV